MRHAQAEHNVKSSRVAGQALDSPLTELGIKQSQQAGTELHMTTLNKIYASPALRCVDTAKIVARQFTNEPFIEEDKRLLEMDQGVLVGRLKLTTVLNPVTFVKLLIQGKNFAFENGESFNQVAERMEESLKEIESSSQGTILVVGHGMAIRCLLAKRHRWSVWRIILSHMNNVATIELE